MLNRFLEIGFKLIKTGSDLGFKYNKYEYHPDYMGNYYVLETVHSDEVIFENGHLYSTGNELNIEYTLSINNFDNKYIGTLFSRNDYSDDDLKYMNSEFERIFKIELRDDKLNQILL